MAINRSSDSLSRCDPSLYSNIYDVRKRPDIKHEPISATQPTHKDTIEISRDKLKEEALNRLRHTSKYVIAHNGFMRIGKYLFLAVALPPYLVLFGLPKWIIVEGVPAIFSMCVWVWKKVQQKTQKRLDKGTQKVAQIVQFMRTIGLVLIQPIVRLALQIRHNIQRMREKSLQFFRQINERVKLTFKKPFIKVTERFKQLQNGLSRVREKISEQTQVMATRLQETVQWMKQSPQLVWGWSQIQFQKMSERVVSWGVKWNKKLQTSQELANRATNWISNRFKNRLDRFKLRFEPLITFYSQQILPQWRQLKEVCKGKWEQARDFFQQKHRQALAFLQKKQEKLRNLSYQHLLDHILSHAWVTKLPAYFQSKLKKWLSHRFVKTVCEIGVKTYSFLARCFLQVLSYLLQRLAQGMEFISKFCSFIHTYARMGCQKAVNAIKIAHQAYHKGVFYTFYYFLLCIIMAMILFMWGVRYLGKVMNSVTPNFSFHR